jgi:hypothetical protein
MLCHHAECRSAECCVLPTITLNVVMMSVLALKQADWCLTEHLFLNIYLKYFIFFAPSKSMASFENIYKLFQLIFDE